MKRIGALSGMRGLGSCSFLAGYTPCGRYRRVIGTLFAVLLMGDADAETEPAEITIHISGQHKGVVSALLAAIDEETPVTRIAELDALATTYGLIGIYRTGRSSGFYEYRFRLTFPPGADVDAIAGAYGNLPYIQAVEAEPPPEARARKMHRPFDIENAGLRLLAKVGAGIGSGVAFTAIASNAIANADNYMGGHILFGAIIGCNVGFPLGVSMVDPYDSLPKTLLASVIPGAVGVGSIVVRNDIRLLDLGLSYVVPVISSLIVSETWRKPPQDRRVSFVLSPTLNGGLSAVTTLRF